jgi:23S rRNA pseudouridine2605 synthase
MPDKKNRNSREDKSPKNSRVPGGSKNERRENSNTDRRKKFESDSDRPYKSRSERSESSSFTEKKYSRPSDDKAGERKSFGGSKERSFEKSDRKPYGAGRSGNSDRRPLGERSFASKRTEGKSFERPGDERPYKKKLNEGDKPFDRKPSRSGDKPTHKPGSGLPYERKPYKKREENRQWSSEEHFQQAPVTRPRKKAPASSSNDDLIRLNRYIANAGICSRRKADELIEAGVISVNGEVVSELGYKVNPAKDVVRYNGETLKREKMIYVLLNKPKDYITTTDDPQERRTVMQLVEKASRERIYPVGRLDRNTTGLLLMTNDGDLAEKLSHPRNNITKIYQVELNKSLTQGDFNKIEYGLELEDGFIKPDAISYVQGASKREIGIQIHTGKNRIVRRIFEQLGYEVVKLDRVVYGSLTKKDLPRGRWRYLEEKEIIQLKHLIK